MVKRKFLFFTIALAIAPLAFVVSCSQSSSSTSFENKAQLNEAISQLEMENNPEEANKSEMNRLISELEKLNKSFAASGSDLNQSDFENITVNKEIKEKIAKATKSLVTLRLQNQKASIDNLEKFKSLIARASFINEKDAKSLSESLQNALNSGKIGINEIGELLKDTVFDMTKYNEVAKKITEQINPIVEQNNIKNIVMLLDKYSIKHFGFEAKVITS